MQAGDVEFFCVNHPNDKSSFGSGALILEASDITGTQQSDRCPGCGTEDTRGPGDTLKSKYIDNREPCLHSQFTKTFIDTCQAKGPLLLPPHLPYMKAVKCVCMSRRLQAPSCKLL